MKRLTRLIIGMACALLLAVGGSHTAEATAQKFSVVTLKQSDYLYTKADFNSKKKIALPIGAKVHVVQGKGEFYQGTYGNMKGYVPKWAFVKAISKKTVYFAPFYDKMTPKRKKYDLPALSDVAYLGPLDTEYDRVRYKGIYGYIPKSAFTKIYKVAQKNTAIYTPALGDPVGEIPVGTNLQILREQRTLYTVLYKGKPTLALKSDIDGIKNYVRIKKMLPEKVFDQTMTVLHPKQPYLDWAQTDYEYVKKTTDKDRLLEEFKMLSEYLNGELISQVQTIKGMYFTPSYTSAKMLVVDNAMQNRLAVLYPSDGKKIMKEEERFMFEIYKTRDDFRSEYKTIDAKQHALNRSRDLEIYNSMDQLPFSEKTFEGLNVKAFPFGYSVEDFIPSGNYGNGTVFIYTNIAQDVSVRTLYHELGHILDGQTNHKITEFSNTLRTRYDLELAPEDFVETHYPYYNKNRYAYDYEFNILPKEAFADFKRLAVESLAMRPVYKEWLVMNGQTLRYSMFYSSANDFDFQYPGFMDDEDGKVHEFPNGLNIKDLPDGLYRFSVSKHAVYSTFTVLVDHIKGFN